MVEPVQTTLEEASRCPRCKQPTKLTATLHLRGSVRGSKEQQYTCENERCIRGGQVVRIITVRPDGTIPPAILHREKQFPEVPDRTREVNDAFAAQLEAEQGEQTPEIRKS
jgi:hypothetical protein